MVPAKVGLGGLPPSLPADLYNICFERFDLISLPCHNHNGWLGIKHQVTYVLDLISNLTFCGSVRGRGLQRAWRVQRAQHLCQHHMHKRPHGPERISLRKLRCGLHWGPVSADDWWMCQSALSEQRHLQRRVSHLHLQLPDWLWRSVWGGVQIQIQILYSPSFTTRKVSRIGKHANISKQQLWHTSTSIVRGIHPSAPRKQHPHTHPHTCAHMHIHTPACTCAHTCIDTSNISM